MSAKAVSKILGPLLLVVGIGLLYFGYQTSQGAASKIGEVFTGRPSDTAMYYYAAGVVCLVLGLGGGGFGFKK